LKAVRPDKTLRSGNDLARRGPRQGYRTRATGISTRDDPGARSGRFVGRRTPWVTLGSARSRAPDRPA
jgi:hypothetical protein